MQVNKARFGHPPGRRSSHRAGRPSADPSGPDSVSSSRPPTIALFGVLPGPLRHATVPLHTTPTSQRHARPPNTAGLCVSNAAE